MPAAVDAVKNRIRSLLHPAGKPPIKFALAIDGGSAELVDGAKLVVVTCLSPALPHDLLLDIELRTKHEDAKSQAKQILRILSDYGLLPACALYLVGDNVAFNRLTVAELNKISSLRHLVYVRCLPHSLNLAMRAFLKPFDKEFHITSFLRSIRAFIKAGGGSSRKRRLAEFALTLSGVDFSDTRWKGFISAIIYMTNAQTTKELERANTALQQAAADGDESAKEALGDPGEAQSHWNAFYELMEDLLRDTKSRAPAGDDDDDIEDVGDGDVADAREEILDQLASLDMFAVFRTLRHILSGVPSIFALLQGGNDFAVRFADRETGVYATATATVRELLSMLESLDNKTQRKDILAEVEKDLQAQAELVCTRSIEYEELSAADVDAWKATAGEQKPAALRRVKSVIKAAVKAVKTCHGRKKLEEALRGLEVRDRFGLDTRPEDLPLTNNDLFNLLGVPLLKQNFGTAMQLRTAWRAHQKAWDAQDAKAAWTPQSPAAVFKHWARFGEKGDAVSTLLAELALAHWLRPLSSASVERIYSILTNMDAPTRRSMKKVTLINTLFLRGNAGILNDLLHEFAAGIRGNAAAASAKSLESRQKAQARAAAASAAAAVATVAPAAAGPQSPSSSSRGEKRKRDSESEGEAELEFE